MIAGLLGKKLGMTQVFRDEGARVPVTVIQVGPCRIMQVKKQETDGYDAVQLGFEDRKRKNATKPEQGHARKAKTEPKRFTREIRGATGDDLEVGASVTAEIFEGVTAVDITGISKGKGFQGTMKRHNFHGQPASHGASKIHRAPGSIGQAAYPSRTFKGVKMSGRMGGERCTTQNLEVVEVQAEKNLLLVKGAVPGHNGSYVIVRSRPAKKGGQ